MSNNQLQVYSIKTIMMTLLFIFMSSLNIVSAQSSVTTAPLEVRINFNDTARIDMSGYVQGDYDNIVFPNFAGGILIVGENKNTFLFSSQGFVGVQPNILYQVFKDNVQVGSQYATLTVNPPPPVLRSFTLDVPFNGSSTAYYNTFVTGELDSVSIVSATKGNVVVNHSHRTITYTPRLNEYGDADIEYIVHADGIEYPGNISVNIEQPPAPTVVNATLNTDYMVPNSIDLANYITGVDVQVSLVNPDSRVQINGTVLTYIPEKGQYGAHTVSYSVTNPSGAVFGIVDINIAIPPSPTVQNFSTTVRMNEISDVIDLSPYIDGYYTNIITSSTNNLYSSMVGDTYMIIIPSSSFVGSDVVSYTVNTPSGPVTGQITVNVVSTHPPVVVDADKVVEFNKSANIDLTPYIMGFYTNIEIISASKGVATINGTNVTYTPNTDEYGSAEVIYIVKSPLGDVNGKIILDIEAPKLPVIDVINITVKFGDPINFNMPNIINGYYTDIEIVSATKGEAVMYNGTMFYTQNLKEFGDAEILYIVKSPAGNVNGRMNIKINEPPLPVVPDINLIVPFNLSSFVNVRSNIIGYINEIEIVSASKGVTNLNGTIITYTPNDGEFGDAEILYVVKSPAGDVNGKIIVNIHSPVSPVVTDSNLNVEFNTANSINISSNIAGYYTGVEIVSVSKGAATIDGTNVTYTPNNNEVGAAEVIYVVKSPVGDVNGKIIVNINNPSLPIVTDANMVVDFNTFNSVDVSSNITGYYTDVEIVSASKGVATIDGTNITYTPNKDEIGAAEVIYIVKSPLGDVNGKIIVEIVSPDVPVLPRDNLNVIFNTNGTIDLSSIIPAGYTEINNAKANKGTVVVSGTTLTYTPNKDEFGSDIISYVVKYPQGDANGEIDVTIKEPDAPEAVVPPIEVNVGEDTIVDLAQYITGYYDSISIITKPIYGSANLNGTRLEYAYGSAAPTSRMSKDSVATDSVSSLVDIVGLRLTSAGRNYDFDVKFNIQVEENLLPVAKDHSVNVIHNGTGSVDVSSGAINGPFTRVEIVQETNGGNADVTGTSVNFKSNVGFGGSASVRYVIYNAYGSSEARTITFSVDGRPDLTQDQEIIGLMTAQKEAADKFARNQIKNFNTRMERIRSETGEYREDDIADININLGSQEQDLSDPASIANQNSGNISLKDFVKPKEWNTKKGYKPYAYWLTGEIGFGDLNKDKGIKYNSVGFTGGVDYRFTPEFVAGIGFGYSRDKVDVGSNGTDLVSKGYAVAAYATYHPTDGIFIDGVLGYSWLDYKTKRFVTPTGDFAYGDRKGNQVFGSVTAGYEMKKDDIKFTPYVRIEGAYTTLDPFTENSGGVYAAQYGKQTSSFISGVVGAKLEYEVKTDYGVMRPYVKVEYTHDLKGSSKGKVGYADVGEMAPVNIRGDKKKSVKVGVGTEIDLKSQWRLGLDYTLETGNGTSHTFGVSLKYRF